MRQTFKEELVPALVGIVCGVVISTVAYWAGGFDLTTLLWVYLAIAAVIAIRYVMVSTGLGSSSLLRFVWYVICAAACTFCFVESLLKLPDNHSVRSILGCLVFALVAVRFIVKCVNKVRQYFRVKSARRSQ